MTGNQFQIDFDRHLSGLDLQDFKQVRNRSILIKFACFSVKGDFHRQAYPAPAWFLRNSIEPAFTNLP